MGAPATHTSAVDGRVIIHLDLDAFYAQVETVRLFVSGTANLNLSGE